MTVTLPYPLAFLSDLLPAMSGRMDIQRRDEASGTGDGRVWSAELAPPIWTGRYDLAASRPAQARSLDARIRGLGANRAMLFADPGYYGPALDPGAVVLGASTVTIHTISADRTAVRLTGLPANYPLSAGDRLSVAHSSGRYWLAELVEPVTASGAGLTALVSVHPYVPLGVTTTLSVNLAAPICKMIIPPGGYTAFEPQPGFIASGAVISLVQKI